MLPKLISFITIVSFLLMMTGCNIFDSFRDDGESDDPEVLVKEGISALENGDYKKAIENANKGLEKDSTNADLFYLHALGTLKMHSVDVVQIIKPFQMDGDKLSKTNATMLATSLLDTTILFNMSELELQKLYTAFITVGFDLERIIQLIESGKLKKVTNWSYWYRYTSDIYLSAGVAKIFTGALNILNENKNHDNFKLDSRIKFKRIGDEYKLTVENISPAEIKAKLQKNLIYFKTGRAYLLWYYVSTLYALNLPPGNANAKFWAAYWQWIEDVYLKVQQYPLPDNPPYPLNFKVDDTPAGIIFKASQELYVIVWKQVYLP